MNKQPYNLDELEEKSSKKLATFLESHLPLLRRAYKLIQESFQKTMPDSNISPSKKACINLLSRACNELRVITLLVEKGYALQAFANAATLFEIGWCVAFIGKDDNFGRGWHWHDLERGSFEKVIATVEGGLKKLSLPTDQAAVKKTYQLYKKLCIGKHVKPIIQAQDPIVEDPDLLLFEPGPRDDNFELLKAWFVILAATESVLPGIESFLQNHVLPVHSKKEVEELEYLKRLLEEQRKGSTAAFDEVSDSLPQEIKKKFQDLRRLFEL